MGAEERVGQAGTLESCDARVTVELIEGTERSVTVEGPMKDVFGDAVGAAVARALDALDVPGARVTVVDRGALDYVLEARVRVAVHRARRGTPTGAEVGA